MKKSIRSRFLQVLKHEFKERSEKLELIETYLNF